LIELVWPKKRIMEVYLNVIEMGNGVYGAEAAAHYYFAKNAQDLNQNEAAWIACILPCPLKYDPKNPTAYLRKRQLHTKTQMRYIGSLKWDQ
jgi:monofunctional biosynthetic peptidoglycan transglycosylase